MRRKTCSRRWLVRAMRYGLQWSHSFRRTKSPRLHTLLRIFGRLSMDLSELVHALLAGDMLTARQCVADAQREHLEWDQLRQPLGLSDRELSVAAGIVELLASRAGSTPPSWTKTIGAVRKPLILDPGLEQMPRSFARAKTDGPEPLRRRNLIALPDFLDVA